MESENRHLERQAAKATSTIRSKSYERPEKYEKYDAEMDEHLAKENRDLRNKIARLEAELSEKELELNRLRTQRPSSSLDGRYDRAEVERLRAAQLQAERLLDAREQSHRQQINRLENQVCKSNSLNSYN